MGDLKNQCCVGVDADTVAAVVVVVDVVAVVFVESTNIDAQKKLTFILNILLAIR